MDPPLVTNVSFHMTQVVNCEPMILALGLYNFLNCNVFLDGEITIFGCLNRASSHFQRSSLTYDAINIHMLDICANVLVVS